MSDRQRKRKLQESLAPDNKLAKDSVSRTNLYLLCFMWDSSTVYKSVLLLSCLVRMGLQLVRRDYGI